MHKSLPTLERDIVTASGERGWIGSWHSHVNDDSLIPCEEVFVTQLIDETRMFIEASAPPGITKHWTLKLRGYLKPRPYDCTLGFGLAVGGRAKVNKYLYYIIFIFIALLLLIALHRWSVGDR